MSLHTQLIDIPLLGGLDTDTDAKVLPVGKLARLENAEVTRQGRIGKRPGYTVLDHTDEEASAITQGDFLAAHDSQLLLFGQRQAYVYTGDAGRDGSWLGIGEHLVSEVRTSPEFQASGASAADNSILSLSVARAPQGDLEVFAWRMPGAVVGSHDAYYSVRSISTGAWLVRGRRLLSNCGQPALTAHNDGEGTASVIVWVVADDGVLRGFVVREGEGEEVADVSIGGGGYNPASPLRVASRPLFGNEAVVVAAEDTLWDAFVVDANGEEMSSHSEAGSNHPQPAIVEGTVEPSVILARATSPGLEVQIHPLEDFGSYIPWAPVDAAWTVATPAAWCQGVTQRSAWFLSGASGCRAIELNATSPVATPGRNVASGLSAYSAPFLVDGVLPAVWAGNAITLGLKLLRLTDGALLATAAIDTLPEFVATQATVDSNAFLASGLPSATHTAFFLSDSREVSRLVLETRTVQPVAARLGPLLVIPGGQPRVFDGISLVDAGLEGLPQLPAPVVTAGSIPAGTHQWVVVPEWTDAAGNVWRGAPSIPRSVVLAAPSNVTFTIPTLRHTEKEGVRLVLFRTEANGTLFMKSKEVANNPAVASVSVTDTAAGLGELLYTTGDVLEHERPPACTMAVAHEGRMWLAGLDVDPYAAAPSFPWMPRLGLGWSQLTRVRVPEDGGPITAMASMDDKLVLFTASRIYVVTGDGPSATGQGVWHGPTLVAPHVGCRNRHSVALLPDGVVFESASGMRMLTRGLQVVPLDEPDGLLHVFGVDQWTTRAITSAVVVPGETRVRWTRGQYKGPGGAQGAPDGALVLDWSARLTDGSRGLYSWWTTPASVHAVAWRGKWARLAANGLVHVEDRSGFDAGAFIPLLLETGWIRLGGLVGYQRAKRLGILGTWPEYCGLEAVVEYDDSAARADTYRAPDNGPVGGAPLSLDVHLSEQKCNSFRVRLTEKQHREVPRRGGLILHGLSLLIGVKRGPTKQSVSKRMTQG